MYRPLPISFSTQHLSVKLKMRNLFKKLIGLGQSAPSKAPVALNENAVLRAAKDAIGRDDLSAAAQQLAELEITGSSNPEVYELYGYVLLALRDYPKAKTVLQSAVFLAPRRADAHYMLGRACMALDEPDLASKSWADCHLLTEKLESLYVEYCPLLVAKGRMEEAKKLMQSGVQHFPRNADIHFLQGNLQVVVGDCEGAVRSYERALELGATYKQLTNNYAVALRNCGVALQHTGDLGRVIELRKRASDIAFESASYLSDYLLAIQYSTLFTREQKFAAHLEYAKRFELPYVHRWGHYRNGLSAGRKIRVGYVSGDFRYHSMLLFIEPILIHHDKSRFEIYGYYSSASHDAATTRLKKNFDYWLDCHDLEDDALEARIRADEIDILIDLSGHTAYNRLPMFARKPAPIQMTWLGYQATTGLSAIDYRITEEALDKSGDSEHFHSEKLLRLPSSGTFSPFQDSPPVNPLPALDNAVFTYACLNNPAKISDDCIKLWSQILHRVPASRLLVGYATPALVEKLSTQFASSGISAVRLAFQPQVDLVAYLAMHHQIDLSLDTFPYNGGTTTFHSLWMGVPVLTLEGDTALSKVGMAIMSGLGLPQFCCATQQDYVDHAVRLASQRPELAAVRQSLRGQMAALTQALTTQVTQYLETALEKCWAEYREENLQKLKVEKNDRHDQAALN